jgi:hypothetical protein
MAAVYMVGADSHATLRELLNCLYRQAQIVVV